MALKKVTKNFERMFDKSLADLVRGIRNNKDNEAKYIAQCIEEIKLELKQDNTGVKSNAVAKLTYLQMCGYDISWAGFNIIEVMSSNRFTCKRVGYLAASQTFHPDTDILMLTTNMIRKDLNSTNQYDAGVALSGLSCFISADLSRDLANDIMTLMSSTKPYLRMKAVLMMYKVFLRYPEALRPAFPKLKEKLEDPDPGVQSAAVNVICELARKNPKNYLSLAPVFFKLMTTSTNNWMLIKIIKLFGALTPLEPRLGKKLIEPLTNLIHSTSAMSLLYECINTVIAVLISISSGMPNHSASIQLCVQKLRILIEDSDQNLKYLGLLAMSKILKTHPKSVQTHKDLILACLDDKDESIRLRALDLLYGMVSKKNLMEIVRRLLNHIENAEGSTYRDELLFKVIEICSQGSYQYVTNFEWYLTVLVELIQLESNSKHGNVIATQLLDVAIRVQAVRTFAVNEMSQLLSTFKISSQSSTMYEVLYAAAWIVGEFSSHLDDPEETLSILLKPRQLPGHIQAVYVQNIIKLFTNLVHDCIEEDNFATMNRLCDIFLSKLPIYLSSADIEVQERANSAFVLLQILKSKLDNSAIGASHAEEEHKVIDILTDLDISNNHNENNTTENTQDDSSVSKISSEVVEIIEEMVQLFVGDLNPVAAKAQRKVQLPEGLDLDEWINEPPSESSDSSDDEKGALFVNNDDSDDAVKSYKVESKEEIEKMRQARLQEQVNNPNYLKSTKTPTKNKSSSEYQNVENFDDIPVAEIALEIPLQITKKRSDKYLLEEKRTTATSASSSKKNKKSKRHKKSSKNKLNYNSDSNTDSDDPKQLHVVNTVIEMPEGAIMSDSEDKQNNEIDDPHRALDIDLDVPLDNELPASNSSKHYSNNSINESSKKKHKNTANNNNINNEAKPKEIIDDVKISKHNKKEKKDKEKLKDKEKDRSKKSSKKDEKLLKEEINLLETDDLTKEKKKSKNSSEKHDKIKKKSKKDKKSPSDNKTDYEEAVGISTPSKEII
uniref:AP-3 complex subunit delta n=1 Tax=Corethrella appendiculata TaxID=1370023 RepID=U5EX37_9DIPT